MLQIIEELTIECLRNLLLFKKKIEERLVSFLLLINFSLLKAAYLMMREQSYMLK